MSLKKIKKIYFVCWLWWVSVAAQGLSLVAARRGYSPVEVCGLIAVASLVGEPRFQAQGSN